MDKAQFEKLSKQSSEIMGPFAEHLLQQSGFVDVISHPGISELTVLDNACGSGVVSSTIMGLLRPAEQAELNLTCADISGDAIKHVGERSASSSWQNTKAVQADAMDTKFPASNFTHVFFNFGPMILADSLAGMRECFRILRPNGILATATWQSVPWATEVREGLASDPSLPSFPDDDTISGAFAKTPERWRDVAEVRSHFQSTGFIDVEVRTATNTTRLEGVQQFVEMLPYTLGMMMPKFWTVEEVQKYKKPAEDAVVAFMKQKYGEGPIEWEWIAVIATGRKGA